MRELFADFVANATRESYLAVAATLVGSPVYAPFSTDLRDVAILCQQERYDEALKKSDDCLWGLILSPRLHLYRSIAFNKLGNEVAEKMEEAVFRACIDGIASTGDGSVTAPFYVTSIGDEYDLLQSLGKKSQGQHLFQDGDRAFDVHRLEDGSEIWFDITDAKRRLDAHYSSGPP